MWDGYVLVPSIWLCSQRVESVQLRFIYSERLTGKIVLVVGGEDSGVKRLTREKCDKTLSIPLFGKVNSLNASVALGIAVYEVVRARTGA